MIVGFNLNQLSDGVIAMFTKAISGWDDSPFTAAVSCALSDEQIRRAKIKAGQQDGPPTYVDLPFIPTLNWTPSSAMSNVQFAN